MHCRCHHYGWRLRDVNALCCANVNPGSPQVHVGIHQGCFPRACRAHTQSLVLASLLPLGSPNTFQNEALRTCSFHWPFELRSPSFLGVLESRQELSHTDPHRKCVFIFRVFFKSELLLFKLYIYFCVLSSFPIVREKLFRVKLGSALVSGLLVP